MQFCNRPNKLDSPRKFYSILYQGPGIRTTLNVCKHAITPLRTQHNLATKLGWMLPLSTVLPCIWFTIDFNSRSTDNSSTPKSFWFLHRTAVWITVHLGYSPTVYHRRRLTARAYLLLCFLARHMFLSSCPPEGQSVVQESAFIWRKAKKSGKWDLVSQKRPFFVKQSFIL